MLSPLLSSFVHCLSVVSNMALRETSTASKQKENPSLLPSLPLFWSDSTRSPLMEWERWFDLFAVAVMAKYSISFEELTRPTDANRTVPIKAITGDMAEEAAEKKVVTRLFFSVGEPARKMFKDKHPHLSVRTLGVRHMIERCRNCFHVAPNRTLDRHKFLSRKQQNSESLQQIGHAFNGLASRCELGEITQMLVHDVFILNMNNKKVQ